MSMLRTEQIVVGDVRSPVLVGGPAGADRREAVVFVHGNPGRGADWLRLIHAVAGFAQVVAPDMPGFGGAEMRADQDYTVQGYAQHLAGIIDALALTRVHVVAHDFGGPWALTFAASNVDLVASVTLVNTGLPLSYRWHRLARIWRTPILGDVFQRSATKAVVNKWLAHDNPGLTADQVATVAGHLRPWGTKRAVLRLYRSTALADFEKLVAPLRAADLPCLVVWGTDDVYLPAALAERQRRAFPSADVHLIPGAGHWVWWERPDDVIDVVVPHLRRHVTAERLPARS